MDEKNRIKYILYAERYHNLRLYEERMMRKLFDDRDEFELYASPLNHILFLHRRIRDTLEVISTTREMRQNYMTEKKMAVLEKNYSTYV